MIVTKAVILAAGLGTRMRRTDGATPPLSQDQAAAASTGVKALIPIDRPFLDYVLDALADAGCRSVCLVIGPHHDRLRDYYSKLPTRRLTIRFAVQSRPLGTADALAAAEAFAGPDPFVLVNSDNYYPAGALRALFRAEGDALIGFDRSALISQGNIAPERIAGFAVVERDAEGYLSRIIEKPSTRLIERMPTPVLVSMNCWRLSRPIFAACRAIDPSPRGEYELPDAVMYSIETLGLRYRVLPSTEAVLDLSRRQDIASVTRQLRGRKVNL